jgi:hypothetical protein
VRLSLTDAGRTEMVDVFREHNERELGWAGALTEDEQRTLVFLLNKLITRHADDGRLDVRQRR